MEAAILDSGRILQINVLIRHFRVANPSGKSQVEDGRCKIEDYRKRPKMQFRQRRHSTTIWNQIAATYGDSLQEQGRDRGHGNHVHWSDEQRPVHPLSGLRRSYFAVFSPFATLGPSSSMLRIKSQALFPPQGYRNLPALVRLMRSA